MIGGTFDSLTVEMEKPVKSGWSYALAVVVLVRLLSAPMSLMPVAAPAKPTARPVAQPQFERVVSTCRHRTRGGRDYTGRTADWIVTVKTADGKPVDNAKVAVDGGMPDHNHGRPTDQE